MADRERRRAARGRRQSRLIGDVDEFVSLARPKLRQERYPKSMTRVPEGPVAFIGRNIRALRRQKKWTQSELGQKLSRRKLSRQAIGWIEAGKNTDLETIADFAATLGVPLEALTSRAVMHEAGATPHEPAAALVDELLARPMPSWSKSASRDGRYRSPEVIRVLLDRAFREFDNEPVRCRAICEVATRLTDRLARPDDEGVPELRVQAWKDLAHVTATLGNPEQALVCLQNADTAASQSANPDHQKAIVEFERSLVMLFAERYAESRKYLLAARPALERYDRRRFFMTLHQEAVLDAVTGDPRQSAQNIERLIEQAGMWNDADDQRRRDDAMHRLYTQAAHSWSKAGDMKRAAEYTRKSAEIHARYGAAAEMARDAVREGIVIASLGDPAASFPKYEEARRQFIALGLHNELVELDFHYLQAKCAAGGDPRELHEICSRLVNAAIAAKLPVTACQAIAWLREISERMTPASVAAVRRFVEESQSRPDLPFEAPIA